MTNEEKFRKGIVVYKNEEDDYVCELWGASTHHADCVFHMNYDNEYVKNPYIENDEYEVFQWLIFIASKMRFKSTAKEIVEYALENWYIVKGKETV